MNQYKDFSYIKYILDLPYLQGLEVYNLCIGRSKKIEENRLEDMLFSLYLFESEHCEFKGSFEDYKKISTIKNTKLEKKDADKEEKRIINENSNLLEFGRKKLNDKKRIVR